VKSKALLNGFAAASRVPSGLRWWSFSISAKIELVSYRV
jgi:hypothetical protein